MTQERSPNQQPIAIVGVSALFPGSTDAAGFWRDILAGRDLIRDVPASHWLVEDYYDPDPSAPDKTYARRGAFLEPIDFDALNWGVPPSTIPATDTAQLLALVLAQQVLQDAAREQFETMDRSRISVILGVTSAQELLSTMVSRLQRPVWVKALRESGLPEDEVQAACDRIAAHYVPWQEASFPGLLGNVVAGRITNRLNLGGTNCVTDAACASTFSALLMGVNELQLGNSDLVITGGVDTLNDIFMFMCFSKTPALSPTGDCRPFSDRADGTMLGEGLGMVALKRLADAERDGDRIYAVVRGVGSSSDGRSKSVYAPVPAGQAQALRRTYALAGYGPETVELVEAHGTGTKAGDAAEFEGLRTVFAEASSDRQWCALGSVKSQIGHTKAAAGAAGLFKAVMALHHKVLPPTIKVDAPNPKLRLEEGPFYLNTRTRPWIRDSRHPRRASVSSFGFGGSNYHVALEEYQGPAPRAERLAGAARELVVICAEQGADVARHARSLIGAPSSLPVIARRSQRAYLASAAARLAILAGDRAELDTRLLAAAQRIEAQPDEPFALPDGTSFGVGAADGKVAFLFPGQGSQYLGMGAEIAVHFGAARGAWDRAADLSFASAAGSSLPLHEVVFPRPSFGAEAEKAEVARLTATEWAQPAIGCASLALLALLRSIGVAPDMVGGHSFGEVTALHAAGVLDEADLLRVARRRGELMAEAASTPGAMTALSLPVEQVRALIERIGARVAVANHNGPKQVVVSGPTEAIAEFEAKLAQERIAAKRLPVATAFHSRVVSAACRPFADFLAGIAFGAGQRPIYANALAAPYPDGPAVLRDGLADQIASPVRFVEMVQAMHSAGARTFIEVGPGSVLTGLVGSILADQPHRAISLDRKGKDGVDSLLLALSRLVAAGVPMTLAALFAEYREPADTSAGIKLAVSINGSNYGKLYPPAGGAKALPPPNPPRAVIAPPPPPPVKEPVRPAGPPARPPSQAAPSPVAQPSAPSAWVLAFQESQRQTADAHVAFQRAMFESHAAYLQVAESAFNGLTAMVTGQAPSLISAPRPTYAAPPVAALVAPAMPLIAAPAPPAYQAPPAQLSVPTPAPAVAAPAPPVAAPMAVVPRAAPAVDLQALMLLVVAEKTGYPADMLNLDMALEGDLGIDSIKRVEILAAVDERAPGMPKVDMNHMGSLQTLRAIVDYMQSLGSSAPGMTPPLVATPPAPAVDLQALMLLVVAEKTGYPADMLNLDMALEGDLGIDSIKRVEILAAVDERAPGMPKVDMNHMGSLQTLRAIVDYMQGLSDGPPKAPAKASAANPVVAAAATPVAAPSALGRYRLERIAAPATGLSQPGLLDGSQVWIVGGDDLDEALAAALRAQGVNASASTSVPEGASSCIYLGGLRAVESDDAALAINREAFAAARGLARKLERERGLFVTIQDTGGAFGLADMDPRRAWLAGLPALVKTAAQEWPRASVKAIDIERGGRAPAVLAEAIAAELLRGGGEVEVALPAAGGRFTLRSVAEPVAPGEPVIGAGDVVVVSGGARGVTAACVVAWAQDCQARFVLLGRTPLQADPACCARVEGEAALKAALLADARAQGQSPTPAELLSRVQGVQSNREIRRTLAAITAAGGQARYEAASVTDPGALTATLDRVRAEWGPIRGVIHGAGVLADKKIAEKTDAGFARVFDTKVQGLRALLLATAADPLKLLCVFSSVSARCGNNGQADYAMANEILCKVAAAEARRRPELLVKALGWGPWEGGMVTPGLRDRFAALGVPMIPLEAGARMMVAELRGAQREQVELVLGGEPRAEALLFEGAEARVSELEVRVGRGSHGYLEGHAINGVPVVPMVLAAEWLARAARCFRPGLALVALHDLKALKGIRLGSFDSDEGERFVIQATQLPSARGAQLQLELRDGRGHLNYSARAALLPEPAAPESGLPALSLEGWDGPAPYQDLLFHRGSFELIDRVEGISDQGVAAVLRGVAQAGWVGGPWELDVAALDGGLQLLILFGHRVLGGPSLPTSIDEIRGYGIAPGLIRAAAYRRKVGPTSFTMDVLFTDAQGRRVAELRGVQNHAVLRS